MHRNVAGVPREPVTADAPYTIAAEKLGGLTSFRSSWANGSRERDNR